MRATFWKLLAAVAVAALPVPSAHGAAPQGSDRVNYYYPENWLCRPDHDEPCETALTATVVGSDGKVTQERFRSDRKAPIDCFYVYPTVSSERTPLSDLIPGREEKEIVRQQLAPFRTQCRLYAPLYRQATLATLAAEARGTVPDYDTITPARDVVNAWRTYIAHDNANRGFVLIGHSQGAAILKYIVAALIDGTPLARQLVSVIIPGTDVDVPSGKGVGGTFAGIPLCRTASDIGCLIVYSSYFATDPPGSIADFGMSSRPGMRDGCVNPGLLHTGGTGLDAVLPARIDGIKTRFRTDFFEEPGMLSAACVAAATHTYLAISIGQGRRAPELQRYLRTAASNNRSWGLHTLDINLAMGDLIATVAAQSKAWLARNRSMAGAQHAGSSP